MLVNELMTRSLYTVNENDTLVHARELMLAHRIRHLPVVDGDNRFIGLLTQRDVLAASVAAHEDVDRDMLDTLESSRTVSEVMNREVIAVDEQTELAMAAELLLDHKFGCLPVLHEGYLTGIVTEADFVRLAVDLIARDRA
jgi:CBS domain-containing membrane protein